MATVSNSTFPVVTVKSGHVAVATVPDMCLVPGQAAPQPFNNWVESSRLKKDKTTSVQVQLVSVCISKTQWGPDSDPAHAGTGGGVTSKAYRGHAIATSYSLDVFCEGGAVVRKDDKTVHNCQGDLSNTSGMIMDADEAWQLLKDKHGRTPDKHFCKYISGYNGASRALINALPEVTAWMNQKLKDRGYTFTVTQEELAANFLAEGGDIAVNADVSSGLNGYEYLGIDSLVRPDSVAAGTPKVDYPWRPYLRPEDIVFAEDSANHAAAHGNDGSGTTQEQVVPLTNLTIEQGLWFNAGMYTSSKARAADTMAALATPADMASMPRAQQLYWGTRFYNASWNNGPSIMKKYGADKPYGWKGDDAKARADPNQPHQNAKRRAACYELMVAKCGAASPQ